jgi:hypothetical protein
VAVIILNAPVNPGGFAVLPAPALVDTLPMKTPVDLVGYGVQGFIRGGGRPQQVFTAIRFFAPSLLIQSNNRTSVEFLKLSQNPAQGKGGTCFGDSGDPTFWVEPTPFWASILTERTGTAPALVIRSASICPTSSSSSTA